jgi:hypothetical protein
MQTTFSDGTCTNSQLRVSQELVLFLGSTFLQEIANVFIDFKQDAELVNLPSA